MKKDILAQPLAQPVPELGDDFLMLWGHRWDYIRAPHASPGESPQWETVDSHTLSDRHIQQGAFLYGVRFGPKTDYFMLDIDRNSPYHPRRDPLAVGRIIDALEDVGVTDHLTVTSSYSGGIHVYFPLIEQVESWKLAAAIAQLLKFKGFLIEDGLLEVFPNVRNYDEGGNTTLFKAHRLPLQAGSYLLDKWWQLERTSHAEFCRRWKFCTIRNELNRALFDRLVEHSTRHYRKLGYKGEKFLNDLNTEIEPGWSCYGQTNYLLGRITLRSYIFGHRLNGGEPLTGDRLVAEIVKVATSLPGYQEYCRHKHEIYQRAEEWARCAENSRYYPYGQNKRKPVGPPTTTTSNENPWNALRKRLTRVRLDESITELLYYGTLPKTITERFAILTSRYGFSGETLYRYPQLWHPDYFGVEPVENPPDPPTEETALGGIGSWGANPPKPVKSLLAQIDRNSLNDADQGWFKGWFTPSVDRNKTLGAGFSVLDNDSGGGNCG